MTLTKFISISWIFAVLSTVSIAQKIAVSKFNQEPRSDNEFRIMFYNVENLFDTFDDPFVDDDEFTKNGEKDWSFYRYQQKLNNLAKTIIAVGGWEPPEIIGLSEVENFQVLHDLVTQTPLKPFNYQIIHENSNDARGIDNALIYRSGKINKILHHPIGIPDLNTRDILYVVLSYRTLDTIHLFVNHWPSRYGGKDFTEHKRMLVAKKLRQSVDSLFRPDRNDKIVIIGDFNDEPNDISLVKELKALSLENGLDDHQLYNLSFPDFKDGNGTLVYKQIDHTWFLFDQVIVSGSLISGDGLQVKELKNHIFKVDWLLKNERPNRSYQGPIYRGGFSDHLPIFIDLHYKK